MLPEQISDIFNQYKKNNEPFDKNIKCWVRDFRLQSEFAFLSVYDGSISENLQIICNKSDLENFDQIENLRGTCIEVYGTVQESPAKGQDIEMVAKSFKIIGEVSDKKSILLSKNTNIDTLRNYQHLRSRFKVFGYVYKIRSVLLKNIHNFFHEHNFYNLDPNVITTSDCEGAGEAFIITTIDANHAIQANQAIQATQTNQVNKTDIYKTDFFQKQAFLTVSSQLQLEALCAGLSRVYTLNPSFRAEKSNTKRHLGCFTHLEWEIAFIDLDQLMDFSEELITNVIKQTMKDCEKEYAELDKFISKGIIEKLNNIINNKFARLSYDEAIDIIEKNRKEILKKYSKELKDIPKWGDDLGSYCEKYISEVIYGKPTFVYNYPAELKSFYMKQNESEKTVGRTVQGCDLLIPGLGELIGSSIREESYEKLINEMDKRGMEKSKLDWYVSLRENSTFPHGGAGLGFDRLVNVCTFMDGNIRDVVPFPVAYQECNY